MRRSTRFVRLTAGVVTVAAVAPAQDLPLLARLRQAAAAAPLVVAHRGASAECPENTVAAFERAVALGAHVVEFDVWQTRDGAWVCVHDATLDRTTDAEQRLGREKVRVDALTLDEVRGLDAGSWFDAKFADQRVPTLAEALAAIGAAVPLIERKGGDAGALVDELRRLDVVGDVVVQAFDWDWLEQVRRREPRLLLGALSGKAPTGARLRDVARTGADIVHWDHRAITAEAAAAVHESGRLLCVYTLDPDLIVLGAAALGCELITTNVPARVLALRAQGRLARRPR